MSTKTSFSLSNAESMPLLELSDLLKVIGSKALQLSIGESSVTQALSIMQAAQGEHTTVNLEAAEGYPMTSMPDIISALGDREWSINIRGNKVSHVNAVAMINAFSKKSASYTLISLNAMPEMAVSAVLEAIGSRPYVVTMDAKHSSPSKIIDSITKISSEHIEISIENTGYIPVEVVNKVMSSVGNRKCFVTFDVIHFNALSLKRIIPSCGPHTSISIETSQALSTAELLDIMKLAAPRHLTLEINGRQFTIDPVNGDKINKVISASDASNTISINTAQYPKLGYLPSLIQSTAHTNLILTYNGAQITDIEGVGNVVVRGIEVAQPSTIIRVNSVGAGPLENYFEILRAAENSKNT